MENGPIVSNAHVVVAFDVLQSQNELTNLAETVNDSSFVITSETNNVSQSLIENIGLIFISKLLLLAAFPVTSNKSLNYKTFIYFSLG